MPSTLHITNGDAVQLTETGLAGEVLIWRDVLHEGPVPTGKILDEMRPIRARFLAGISGQSEDEIRGCLERRDQTLARFAGFGEVILWFEHDLYDQLQLIQILDWFSRQDLGRTTLSLIATDRYLGQLRPDELRRLYPGRQLVSQAQLELAARAWAAFTAADPVRMVEFVREDTSLLPHLGGALLRHLEQFPSVRNGLSRTQQQILRIADAGPSSVQTMFCADRDLEERIFMGDLVFNYYVRALANARVPLLRTVQEANPFGKTQVAITAEGKAVMRGEQDHLNLNGIDCWLGGVHLHGNHVWRWNGEQGRLESSRSPSSRPIN